MDIVDDLGRVITIDSVPQKVVSLVPSVTETLCELGLSSYLSGITEYCIHPVRALKKIRRIGGTKTINTELIRQIQPSLIIAVKEENPKKIIEGLSNEFPCFVFDINGFDDALKMIKTLGIIFNCKKKAGKLKAKIIKAYRNKRLPVNSHSYLYLVWKDPYMAAGTNTFIDDVLQKFGFRNVVTKTSEKYPEVDLEALSEIPDIVFLPTEPCHFTINDGTNISELLKSSKIIWINGEACSWYGSRMLRSGPYLRKLANKHSKT